MNEVLPEIFCSHCGKLLARGFGIMELKCHQCSALVRVEVTAKVRKIELTPVQPNEKKG